MDCGAVSVHFDSRHLFLDLSDGRAVQFPLDWFPILQAATSAELRAFCNLSGPPAVVLAGNRRGYQCPGAPFIPARDWTSVALLNTASSESRYDAADSAHITKSVIFLDRKHNYGNRYSEVV
ncbi:DUF2442 domain-containing protein [Paraburkholderia fungorum]|uniref:DUF2442 domain-containing protein n=1 Tax=Paraburkholderia fungorum TaxID=134537 RepID=UPI0038BE0E7F